MIIGGGFAGLKAALGLRKAPVRVTVVDRRNHHLFQPLLYQVATGTLDSSDIAHPIREMLKRQPNTEVAMGEVVEVDVEAQEVRLADGTVLPYDYLVAAAGASHAYFGRDEWEPFAPGLKTLEDAQSIRSRVLRAFEDAELEDDPAKRAALMTFILVGAGPSGVEMAGSLAELVRNGMTHEFRRIDPAKARVMLVEALDRVLPPFPPDLSAEAHEALTKLGVEVRLGKPVTNITAETVTIGDEPVPCRMVIWTAGVKASPIGGMLGAELDRAGRVKVQPDLSLPGRPNVFVAGDLASLLRPDGRPVPGIAPAAMQQGTLVARNVVRAVNGLPGLPFEYNDKGNMAIIGRFHAVAAIGDTHFSGLPAWATWLGVHLAYLDGGRNRLITGIDWAWSLVGHTHSNRLILGKRPVLPGGEPLAAKTAPEREPVAVGRG